ncbi:MAG: epimerase, partial [Burkholderiales bacterium]|nr:epimerase [Burkholderiales bacterium]
SQQRMVEEMGRQTGHKVKTRVAGPWLVKMMGWFQPFMRELVEMHYLQTRPVLLDDSALTALLGTVHKTPYEAGIRACLAALQTTPDRSAALTA